MYTSKQRSKHEANVMITVDQYGKVSQNTRFNPTATAKAAAVTFKTHQLANNHININVRYQQQYHLNTSTCYTEKN